MKVSVVHCDCDTPISHRKFEAEDGRRSQGFACIKRGKEILDGALATGLLQTEEETVATINELNSCGLQEDMLTDDEIILAIADGLRERTFIEQQLYIAEGVLVGALSIEMADKISARLRVFNPRQCSN